MSETDLPDSDSAASAATVTATSEGSWMVTTEVGGLVFGHVINDDDRYTAYDAQELRIGTYDTRDEAVSAIIDGTT